jgi:hypothetical protein
MDKYQTIAHENKAISVLRKNQESADVSKSLFVKKIKSLIAVLSFFGLLFPAYPILAKNNQANQGYIPPNKDKQEQNATASGSRGCQRNPVDITPLIPTNHTPTTISTHPNFLFSVQSEPKYPVRFTLVEPGVAKPVWEKDLIVARSGIMSVSIPENVNLEANKEYVWNLVVVCNPNRPSENYYIRAAIKRVSSSQQLVEEISQANSHYQKALILARAGIWYDAIYTSYKGKNEVDSISYFKQLLSQIGLTI